MATWVGYPRSYTKGRNRPIQYVVIHSTEGAEGPSSAEDGAAYDKRRTDGTSTHLFVDSDSAVREVPDADRAHAARFHGNEIGIQVELCGRANQSAVQWHDPAPLLQIAAREVAALCREHDIPVRRLSVGQVRAAYYASPADRPKGICGHVDVTAAYPEDGGTHSDPGSGFPWAEFLAMVQAEMEDDMPTAQEIAAAVWNFNLSSPSLGRTAKAADWLKAAYGLEKTLPGRLDAILAAAQDDDNTTVVLAPEALAELTQIRDQIASLPEALRPVVDSELDEQAVAGADKD